MAEMTIGDCKKAVSAILHVAAAIFVISAWFLPQTAFAQSGAHGDGHAEHHDWYKDLKQPGTGFSCCNGDSVDADGNPREGDCRPTRADLREDGWWAVINGHWTRVPASAVLKEQAADGRSHICAGKSGFIYCFLAGSPKI
ncbi:MAG: hypothetical protein K0R61_53 [Microvirga sp.]|jgi:hypothetical protein|nr:hypothetical protein [Microvirga sp.]MDF2969603.1 hypothetical protein [Microvirga sp.]